MSVSGVERNISFIARKYVVNTLTYIDFIFININIY